MNHGIKRPTRGDVQFTAEGWNADTYSHHLLADYETGGRRFCAVAVIPAGTHASRDDWHDALADACRKAADDIRAQVAALLAVIEPIPND